MDDLEKLERTHAVPSQSLGLLALVGAWGNLDDSEIDEIIRDIYEARDADTGRPIDLES
jgi:hypothetical protein